MSHRLGGYLKQHASIPSSRGQKLAVFAVIAGVHLALLLWWSTRLEVEPTEREFVTYYEIGVFSPETGALVPLATQGAEEDSARAAAARQQAPATAPAPAPPR